MSTWDGLIELPANQYHLVQFYNPEAEALRIGVVRYLREGLNRGEGVLVIASRAHIREFRRFLEDSGAHVDSAERAGRLVFFDALDTLSMVMVDGRPDRDRFEEVMATAMARIREAAPFARLRAFGEMVDILWAKRQFAAAIRLEQLWNRLLSRSSFSLYCAYAVDVFGAEFQIATLDRVLRSHTHIVPSEKDGRLDAAIDRAMEEILGPAAGALRLRIEANTSASWGLMPAGERTALWLRAHLPEKSEAIMRRAREHCRAAATCAAG